MVAMHIRRVIDQSFFDLISGDHVKQYSGFSRSID
jgi:hypothetical protein